MAFFSHENLEAVGIREKLRLCEKCGKSMDFVPGEGFCCPGGHGCEWPAAELDPPEELKARCYHQGGTKPSSQSKGRKRKKKPPKQDFSYLYSE